MLAKQNKLAGQKQRLVEVAGVVISVESDLEEFPVCCFGGNATIRRAVRCYAGVDRLQPLTHLHTSNPFFRHDRGSFLSSV